MGGSGLLSRMKSALDSHSSFLENIEGEDGVEVRSNYKGGITIYRTAQGVGSFSKWSGIVFHLGEPKWDFNRVDNDPEEVASEFGLFGVDDEGVYQGSVGGELLAIDRTTGEATWSNRDDADPLPYADSSTKEYFLVAEYLRDGEGEKVLDENEDPIYVAATNRTCGDIHVFSGGALAVAGTPAPYKGLFLLGWKKTTAEAEWTQMTSAETTTNAPTRLWESFIDGVDDYPWCGLRPMWDYPRTHA